MIDLKRLEMWFVTGSQQLYGAETLKRVAVYSQEIAGLLNDASAIPAIQNGFNGNEIYYGLQIGLAS